MTTTTQTTLDERKAQLLAELAQIEAQERAQEQEQAARARQRASVAAVAIVQLRPRYRALLAAACAVEEQIAQARTLLADPAQPTTTTQTPPAAGKPNNYPMRFYQAFVKTYKKTGVTQKQLTALCKVQGIDQSDRGQQNLQRAYDALCAARAKSA